MISRLQVALLANMLQNPTTLARYRRESGGQKLPPVQSSEPEKDVHSPWTGKLSPRRVEDVQGFSPPVQRAKAAKGGR
jgi:hypothetical protein